MATRTDHRQAADKRSAQILARVGREVRQARRQQGLSQASVAEASGTPRSKVSRVERAVDHGLSIADATAMLASVGLALSVNVYPDGDGVRDAAHTALLERLRLRLSPSLGWQTEVPLPIAGDRRAWDAVIRGERWRFGVEAETHPEDRQALERKLNLKVRDGAVQGVVLVLARTAVNRRFVEANAEELRRRFPVSPREAMAALRDGRRPAGDALLLL